MLRERFVVATLCALAACGNSTLTTSTNDGTVVTAAPTSPAVAAVASYRVALARCLDAANLDLPDRAVGNVTALDAANEACDEAVAEVEAADLPGAMRTAVDALQRELASLDAALERARLHVANDDFDEAAQSELLSVIELFQAAASQIL